MPRPRLILAAPALLVLLAACGSDIAKPVTMEHVPHFAWMSSQVARGGQPRGEIAFEEIAGAGVRTVISVDGAAPAVAAARKHGLRYVHIPIGYNGLTEEQVLSIAKTVREIEGPFFIHCHHGKHRGPAAAVIAQMVLGGMTPGEAEAELERAGTAEKYKGLWSDVREFEAPSEEATASFEFDFPETAPVPDIAAAMAVSGRIFDNLKAIRGAGWTVPPEHPDIDPPHEALLMTEQFAEILRTKEAANQGVEFLEMLEGSLASLKEIEAGLGGTAPDPETLESPWRRLSQSCSKCHKKFRDVPLSR